MHDSTPNLPHSSFELLQAPLAQRDVAPQLLPQRLGSPEILTHLPDTLRHLTLSFLEVLGLSASGRPTGR
jgi:hypothetical protein